jgi:hypothetical protein
MGMFFLVVDPTLGKKKNGYGVYFKETASNLQSDWLIKKEDQSLVLTRVADYTDSDCPFGIF